MCLLTEKSFLMNRPLLLPAQFNHLPICATNLVHEQTQIASLRPQCLEPRGITHVGFQVLPGKLHPSVGLNLKHTVLTGRESGSEVANLKIKQKYLYLF